MPNDAMSYAELVSCGVSRRRIRTMVLHQPWQSLRRSVYCERGDVSVRRLLAAAEVALKGRWVASHGTAAHLHGLVLLHPPRTDRLVLTVESTDSGHADLPGIHRHRAGLPRAHVTMLDGVPVTTRERTLVDLARALTLRDGLVAIDAAVHSGQASIVGLAAVVSDCRRWPYVRRARTLVELADCACESPLESLSRLFFIGHGIPMPRSQITLTSRGSFLGRADFWWERQRVVGEADGLSKYTDASVLRAEKLRQERLENAGLRVVRWTWTDVDRPSEARRTAARLRRALDITA